ncbi:MAG TPA: hypothetical protein V6C57_20735 [Coleofasciculaceae cyanobacterium]
MVSQPDCPVMLRLSVEQLTRPELLTGLESWRHLALLSDAQVMQFCQEYLTCPLPLAIAASAASARVAATSVDASAVLVGAIAAERSDFAPDAPLPAPPHPLTQSLRSFMAEVSIIWLLFLGVFMVVVSSGVLAATQWQNFSVIGQYGILFAYTIAFAVASLWTRQKSNLRLTSRMLQLATLLLIPVNFWMMDGLKVGASVSGLGLSAIASLSLTAILVRLLRPQNGWTEPDRLMLVNSIGLSWLHWGWGWAGIPLIATYGGTVGTALLLGMQQNRRELKVSQSEALPPDSSFLPDWVILLAALLLIGRAVLAAQVPITQLGLAIGLCGWVLSRLHRRTQTGWRWAGMGLLLLGWWAALPADPPWQAIAISGLGLWFFIERLRIRSSWPTLVASFLVGLEIYGLLWRTVPSSFRAQAMAWAVQIAGDRGMPTVLLGVGLFPYLLLALGVAAALRQRATAPESAVALSSWARQLEVLALILGIGLTLLSWDNLWVRSLNLTLSALTLLFVFRKRRSPLPLLYLTHMTAGVALLSWVELVFPELSDLAKARILLGGMAIEWSLCLGTSYPRWRRSAWHLGLALAACSYLLLLSRVLTANTAYEQLIGLLIPLGLTGLSRSPTFANRQFAAWLSAVMLVAQLFLLNLLNAWLISLGVAMLLMLVNTRTLRHMLAAVLTLGFALGCEATIALQLDNFTATAWVNLFAATLWLLWLLRGWLWQRQAQLSQLYAFAANIWAIGLCTLTLLLLTVVCIFEPTWGAAGATGLTMSAIAYRLGQQPTNLGFYGLAWSGQILVILLVNLTQGSLETAAMATLALGLFTQMAAEVWVSHSRQSYRSSWHLIPLLYAGLGGFMGHGSFTATTGLLTLAVAGIGIGVGRRLPRLKPLSILSLLLVSVAAYELLIYQLLQAQGGNPGDGVALLAGLAAAIALTYRGTARWLLPYLRLAPPELQGIAHLHWAIGSSLAIVALSLSLSPTGAILWLGVVGGLAGYALAMGRITAAASSAASSPDLWIYAGLLELIAALSYALYRLIPDTSLLQGGAGAIASLVAVGLYFLPWQRWGWPIRPWRTVAVLLPAIAILLTVGFVSIQSLLITAAWYAWLAKSSRQIRLSYVSILLLDWALLRYLNAQGWHSALGLGLVWGGSLLYVAQVDPGLQNASARQQRHWLRSLATGLISLTALYQAEVETGTAALWVSLLTLGLSIGLMFLGLVLRVRAFLYIGTALFMLRVLRLLWLFINTDAALLWGVGIVIGLLFIWIAATYEARRSQLNALLQYWLTELASWE